MKGFFSRKILFYEFSKFKNFQIFLRKFTSKVDKTFLFDKQKKNVFDTNAAINLPPLPILEKIRFSSVKAYIFSWRNKKIGTVIKITFYLSTRTFWWNIFSKKIILLYFLLQFEEEFLGLVAKNLRQICQNCIWRVQRNFLRIFCQKKQFHHGFRTSKNFQDFQ